MITWLFLACAVQEVAPDTVAPIPEPSPAPAPPSAPAFDPTAFTAQPMVSVPLLGGTMVALPGLGGVLAADPDGDRLVRVPESGPAIAIPLSGGDRPFRIAVEGDRAWVTLRGPGAVVEIDLALLQVTRRTTVCPEPRGLARTGDRLAVACAGGELVLLDDSGAIVQAARLDADLRDVVARDDALLVSRFRFGEVLTVDPTTLAVTDVISLGRNARMVWRMRDTAKGVLALYDETSTEPIGPDTNPFNSDSSPYGGGDTSCGTGTHVAAIGRIDDAGFEEPWGFVDGAVVPVDFDVAADGALWVANGGGGGAGSGELLEVTENLADPSVSCTTPTSVALPGEALASSVVLLADEPWVQTQGAAAIRRGAGGSRVLWTSGEADHAPDAPFPMFHRDAGAGVACASCHPEGQDDGNVWTFLDGVSGTAEAGRRRTLPLAGDLLDRAPYHWMGELPLPGDLMRSTFVAGMGGSEVSARTTTELFSWLHDLRPVRRAPGAAPAILAQGEATFYAQGCDSCHAGPLGTDNQIVSVRAGELAKTPALVGLGMRSAWMHDGCASSIEARLTGEDACTGGAQHGDLSGLDAAQIQALAAWLETF
jgi:hypothetical protein